MWLLTTFGFFSTVQKPGEELLTIRARSAGDLDRLRDQYLSILGPTETGTGTDYRHRARAEREELARAMGDIVRDLSYSNFKNAVGKEMGHGRAKTYAKVWSALHRIQEEPDA